MIGQRVAPAETIRGLREIDPQADLVKIGGDDSPFWMLGVRNPSEEAKKAARRRIARLRESTPKDPLRAAAEIELMQHVIDGLRTIELYEVQKDADFGKIVSHFRQIDFEYRQNRDKAFERRLDHSSGDHQLAERQRIAEDYADTEAASVFRFALQHAVSRVQGVIEPLRSSVRHIIRRI